MGGFRVKGFDGELWLMFGYFAVLAVLAVLVNDNLSWLQMQGLNE